MKTPSNKKRRKKFLTHLLDSVKKEGRNGEEMGPPQTRKEKTMDTKTMDTTITFYFYDKKRELSIGDKVTVAQVSFGETRGERAKLEKITARYAEFVTTSGSRVKVYAQTTPSACWYLGHKLPSGWQKGGWFIDVDPEREITVEKHPEYLAFVKKTGSFEWFDR